MTDKTIPFALDRSDARSLARQLVDGFREAITAGYYKPGDVLPSYRDLAPMLGVSEIVTKGAIKQLSEDGYVTARPRIGTIVRNRVERMWRGHVVLVQPEGDDVYILTVIAGMLRDALTDAGWLFSQVRVRRDARGRADFAHLDAVLSRRVDLAISLYPAKAVARHLAKMKVPHAVFSELPGDGAHSSFFMHLDANAAVGDFAAFCALTGVEKVVKVFWDSPMCDISGALAARSIATEERRLAVDTSHGRLEAVRRAGMEYFLKLAGTKPFDRKTLYLVADDYLAAGALTALGYAGLRAPEDLRLAIWATSGIAAAYPRALSRMEIDPVKCGRALASDVLEYLHNGAWPEKRIIGPVWNEGETAANWNVANSQLVLDIGTGNIGTGNIDTPPPPLKN